MDVLPSSKDAEMMVLGCMLQNIDHFNEGCDSLDDIDFFFTEHRVIFQAMCFLLRNDSVCEVVTLSEELKSRKQLHSIGGVAYLVVLCQYCGTSASLLDYIDIVKNKSTLRKMILASKKIEHEAYQDPEDVPAVLDKAQREFFHISQGIVEDGYITIGQIIDGSKTQSGKPVCDQIEEGRERHSRLEKGLPVQDLGVSTGFYDLDDMIDGFGNSNLIILAARPGMGKSALAVNIAENVVFKSKKPVGIFSLEMSAEQLVYRILCSQAEVPGDYVRKGTLSTEQFEKIKEISEIHKNAPFLIDDQAVLTVFDLRNRARRMKESHGIHLLIVDYLQLLSSGKNYRPTENRQVEVSEISRTLKSLAKELNIPILCLSQLSREVEKRADKRPVMSDLRESGALEQDADVVMMLYRREYYDPMDKPGQAQLLVVKNRHGSVGSINIQFEKDLAKFNSLAKFRREIDDRI